MTVNEILQHYPDAQLEPGIYLLFTEEDEIDTYCLPIKDITKIQKGGDDYEDYDEETITITFDTETESNQIARPMGSVYLVTIPNPVNCEI